MNNDSYEISFERLPGTVSVPLMISVLHGNYENLSGAFYWIDTPQGHDYWHERRCGYEPLSRKDREQIVVWLGLAGA